MYVGPAAPTLLAMSTLTQTEPAGPGASPARYSLGRTPDEYRRLREQARAWEPATSRVLDLVGIPGAGSCLDAGCGPGETTRLLAERVGPHGRVVGVDVDAGLGAMAEAMLHASGHRQCTVLAHDLTDQAPLPGPPFDVVYARLLLFHLPERVAVLARLWSAVAPGGCLVVQDYDVGPASTLPSVPAADELKRVIEGAFGVAGADVHVGARLPRLFAAAGVGQPDGTDVAGRLEPLATGQATISGPVRSLLPVAVAAGITTEAAATEALAALEREARLHPDYQVLWPLLIGAWKWKEGS